MFIKRKKKEKQEEENPQARRKWKCAFDSPWGRLAVLNYGHKVCSSSHEAPLESERA